MSGFDALLHLQEIDIQIDQLEHRYAHLPERDAVAANGAAQAANRKELDAVQAERDALAREQKRIEDEVATVEDHATDVNKKLYSGSVTAPKELQALQDDYDSLKRRQTVLEDQVIELMEQAEPLDERLAALAARQGELEREGDAATVALAEVEAEVSAEQEKVRAERVEALPAVPADLVAEYDRLRPQFAGIAVARLVGTNCHGCHLSLSSMALDRIRKMPPDALVLCDECGRILIH